MSILVTGGTGYIGSHTVIQLLAKGYNVIILDNFSNSKLQVIRRMTTIADKQVKFLEGDIRNRSFVRDVLDNNKIDVVMHFAGLKAVGESESFPLKYYDNNVNGSVVLLEEMQRAGVKKSYSPHPQLCMENLQRDLTQS